MKKVMRAIVVEDERLPRLTLLQKLEDLRSQVEVVDSCDNYDDAIRSILQHKPDLLFLDIQLNGRTTLQLLEELKSSITLPKIIFTTAYSDRKFLISAIKISAVDYLLKPVDKTELALAVNKAWGVVEGGEPSMESSKLSFRTVNGRMFVERDDIAYIKADGNYVQMTMFDGQETVLESLASIEHHLGEESFLRVDRSTIINIHTIYKLNTKRKICILKSHDGAVVEVEISKSGIDLLSRQL